MEAGAWGEDDVPIAKTFRDNFRVLEWLSLALIVLGALIAIAGVLEAVEFWSTFRRPTSGALVQEGGYGTLGSNLRLARSVLGALAFGAGVAALGYVLDLLLTIGADLRELVDAADDGEE